MTKAALRIYLSPDPHGRLQQTPDRTRDFYDVDPRQFLDARQTRWYRVTQTSPGRAFTALWSAGSPEQTENVTLCELGALMRVFSNQWYVDSRDLCIEDAADLRQGALTRPRALALALALIVLVYVLFMNLLSQASGQNIPAIQPLARFAASAMILLLVAEQLLNQLRKWMRQSQRSM
jgi:hypothetical protein